MSLATCASIATANAAPRRSSRKRTTSSPACASAAASSSVRVTSDTAGDSVSADEQRKFKKVKKAKKSARSPAEKREKEGEKAAHTSDNRIEAHLRDLLNSEKYLTSGIQIQQIEHVSEDVLKSIASSERRRELLNSALTQLMQKELIVCVTCFTGFLLPVRDTMVFSIASKASAKAFMQKYPHGASCSASLQ